MSTCLITGGAGNLACQLTWNLAATYEKIVLIDVAPCPVGKVHPSALFEGCDLLNANRLDDLFGKYQPAAVIHLASLLSGSCELNRPLAWQVNMDATFSLFEILLRHNRPTTLFASSVATYGGSLPEVLSDDIAQWPTSLYGVTKVAAERMGHYYHVQHGLDFRCLRLPITISRHAPTGAASAFASHAFIESVQQGKFTFRARSDTKLAVIYVRDVLRAFAELLAADSARLHQRVYNIGSMSITPDHLAQAIRQRMPKADLRFEPEEQVSKLLAGWPGAIDDSAARNDWNWAPKFDLEQTTGDFIAELQSIPGEMAGSLINH